MVLQYKHYLKQHILLNISTLKRTFHSNVYTDTTNTFNWYQCYNQYWNLKKDNKSSNINLKLVLNSGKAALVESNGSAWFLSLLHACTSDFMTKASWHFLAIISETGRDSTLDFVTKASWHFLSLIIETGRVSTLDFMTEAKAKIRPTLTTYWKWKKNIWI